MLDKILEIGTNLDWISPVAAIAQNIANGPSHTFLIPANCGRTGREIINLLRSRGVKTWGHMIINDTITISVPESQVDWAQRLLDWAGVPTGDHVDGQCQQQGAPKPRKPDKPDREQGHLSDLRDIGNYRLW